MIKPWTRNKTLISIIIALSLIGIYFISSLYVLSPLRSESKNVKSEVSVYETQIEKLESPGEGTEGDELDSALLQMPDDKSPDDILSTIQRISTETKVIVEGIRSTGSSESINEDFEEVEEVEEGEESVEVASAFSIRDSYAVEISAGNVANINAFLDQIVITNRLLTIDTLYIDQSDSEPYAEITFSAYHTNP